MIILNLFIGVIMKGMDEAQAEAAALDAVEAKGELRVSAQLASLQDELARLQRRLGEIQTIAVHVEGQRPPEPVAEHGLVVAPAE